MLTFLLALATAQTPGTATAPETTAAPDAAAEPASWRREGFGWGAIPAVNYNSDEGFGFGALGNLYRYNGETAPYKWNFGVLIFLTTKGIHDHRVEIDALNVAHTPLRLTARVNLQVTRAGNFCGLGSEVSCALSVAEDAASAQGLTGDARATFVRRYYKVRYTRPYGYVNARYALDPLPHKVELFGGWRGEWHQPGDFTTHTPFPGSAYATVFPEGETGFLSVLQAGIMLDNRDNEPAPTSGYWVEASLRGATPLIGSAWSMAGGNVTLRGYAPLTPNHRLVAAGRVVLDAFTGDAPVREWANPGGATLYEAWGGLNAGRGIRARRYLGRIKLIAQPEARWTFLDTHIGASLPVALTALTFLDVAAISEDPSGLSTALTHPSWGTGGGLRLAVDTNFILRMDVGVSPAEAYAPSVYIDINNLF